MNMNKRIVLERGEANWKANGSETNFKKSIAAGDVAKFIARLYPDMQIGVASIEFGPATTRVYGPVVWMKKGFHLQEA